MFIKPHDLHRKPSQIRLELFELYTVIANIFTCPSGIQSLAYLRDCCAIVDFKKIVFFTGWEIWWAESRRVELWCHPFRPAGGMSRWHCAAWSLQWSSETSHLIVKFIWWNLFFFFIFCVFCRAPSLLTMTIYVSSWRRWRVGSSTCPTSSHQTVSPCLRAWLRSTPKRGSRYETVCTQKKDKMFD